jgi:hypothetical protein
LQVNVVAYGVDGKKYPWNPDTFDEDEFSVESLKKFMSALGQSEFML